VHTPLGSLYRFGPFQVNSVSGELLKNGNRVKLQEQPFRLLVILLENAGEVVTRDDLRHRIWRDDTFVDFDSSLRVAVGKLREALGDDAENPRYVETIPKRGYRFLAPEIYREVAHGIGELGASPSSAETAAPDDSRGAPLVHRSNWSLRWMLASVLLLTVVAGIAIAFRTFRQQRPQEEAALTAVPLTALRGRSSQMQRVREPSVTAASPHKELSSSSFEINLWGLCSRNNRARNAFGSTVNILPALMSVNSRSRTSTNVIYAQKDFPAA
jgi:DNA-binding winged helix-turn-helix (wHTH) protein